MLLTVLLEKSLKYVWFSMVFYLLWKFHRTSHSLYLTYFLRCNDHSGYKGLKFSIRIGHILILKNKVFLDEFRSPEIFTLDPNLCLKVYDGNLGDMLTQKLAALSITSFITHEVFWSSDLHCTLSMRTTLKQGVKNVQS